MNSSTIARPPIPVATLPGALLAATLALAACQGAEAPPPPPPQVVVADVIRRDVAIQREWVGTIEGNVTAQIRARVQGYLQEQHYAEGTLVRQGDLLFSIDRRPYRAALDQAQGEVGRAEAALAKSEQDVERYTPLAAEQAISQEELDNAIQHRRANRAALDSARAVLEKAQLDLDWTEVRSPIDGIAGIATADVGDLVGESTLLTIVSQVDPVRVSFPISEQEYLEFADRIELSNPKPTEARFELILADGNMHADKGRATVVNREVDVKTGTMMVVALFPNPKNLLRPGQYAKVRATLETRKDAVLVPQRAVQELQGSFQVAVVDKENKVAMRPIRAGPRVGNLLVVESGLQAGERTVVEGLQKVRDGAIVAPTVAKGEPSAEEIAEQKTASTSAEAEHE